MKRIVIFCSCILVATGSTMAEKQKAAITEVTYVDSDTPGTCRYPAALPAGCTALPGSSICTTALGGGYLRTHYQGTGCQMPYYYLGS